VPGSTARKRRASRTRALRTSKGARQATTRPTSLRRPRHPLTSYMSRGGPTRSKIVRAPPFRCAKVGHGAPRSGCAPQGLRDFDRRDRQTRSPREARARSSSTSPHARHLVALERDIGQKRPFIGPNIGEMSAQARIVRPLEIEPIVPSGTTQPSIHRQKRPFIGPNIGEMSAQARIVRPLETRSWHHALELDPSR